MDATSRDAELADHLSALGSAPRLAILRALRTPSPISVVSVAGEREDAGSALSRQAVRKHVERLTEIGVVRYETDARGRELFVVNHQRLFMVAESLRDLVRLRPALEPLNATVDSPADPQQQTVRPGLLLVHGLDVGASFDLRPGTKTIWRIGRRRGLDVSLDYDPTVSAENAFIHWDGKDHLLEDAGATNGTSLNLRRLPPGQQVRLSHGDLIGVGRSLLEYVR